MMYEKEGCMGGMIFSGAEYMQNPRLQEALKIHADQQRTFRHEGLRYHPQTEGPLTDGQFTSLSEPSGLRTDRPSSLREIAAFLHNETPDAYRTLEEERLASRTAEQEQLTEARRHLESLVA